MRKLSVDKRIGMTKGDMDFLLDKAMPFIGVEKLKIDWSNSKKLHPDIWCFPIQRRIVVTQEWKKQNGRERKCRLIHELLHFKGLKHGIYGNLEYSTYPWKDTYSKNIYRDIIGAGIW